MLDCVRRREAFQSTKDSQFSPCCWEGYTSLFAVYKATIVLLSAYTSCRCSVHIGAVWHAVPYGYCSLNIARARDESLKIDIYYSDLRSSLSLSGSPNHAFACDQRRVVLIDGQENVFSSPKVLASKKGTPAQRGKNGAEDVCLLQHFATRRKFRLLGQLSQLARYRPLTDNRRVPEFAVWWTAQAFRCGPQGLIEVQHSQLRRRSQCD